jgi:O-antigen ligase
VIVPIVTLIVLGPHLVDPIKDSAQVRIETIPDVGGRLETWKEGWSLFKKRPWFGYGWNMSRFAKFGRVDATLAKAVYRLYGENYHSAHLQLALDLGIPGLVLFWWILFTVIQRGYWIFRRGGKGPTEIAGIVFFAAFLALVGDSFVHGWAFSPGGSVAIIFWVCALAVIRIQLLLEKESEVDTEIATTEPSPPVPTWIR